MIIYILLSRRYSCGSISYLNTIYCVVQYRDIANVLNYCLALHDGFPTFHRNCPNFSLWLIDCRGTSLSVSLFVMLHDRLNIAENEA